MGICDSHTVMEFADDICSMKIKWLNNYCGIVSTLHVTCSDYYAFNAYNEWVHKYSCYVFICIENQENGY